ncbi:MAG: WG repeat-containing protein [Turicibacter sp.]|nr:WG repeat-containing protein [Turicibacter sp.]
MLGTFKAITILVSLLLIGGSWGLFATINARLLAEQASILSTARNLRDEGQYDEAITLFNQAMEMTEGIEVDLLYEVAQVRRSAGLFSQYREDILTLIENETPPSGQNLADLYLELANFDLEGSGNLANTVLFLREGWEATNDSRLFNLHEQHRYIFDRRGGIFTHISIIQNDAGRVRQGEIYGFVNQIGNNLMSPTFELATDFANDLAVVQNENGLHVVNRGGQIQATADFRADSIAHFNGATFALRLASENYYRLGIFNQNQLIYDNTTYNFIGMPSENIQAFQQNDLWALHDVGGTLPFTFTHEGFAMDELGRVAVNGRMFLIQNGRYQMVDLALNPIGSPFDEARPFFEVGGLAAVRQGDLWGFANANGEVVIDFRFRDAKSSSENLAPVMTFDLWGFLTVEDFPPEFQEIFGTLVIESQFIEAGQFINGVAPVRQESGWFYIMLIGG